MTVTPADPPVARTPVSPFARILLEGGPLAVFFIGNRLYGIQIGTAAFMVATLAAVALSWRLERRIPLMPLVSCVFVLAFGGLTLWLDDDLFIKIKPTVVNLLFSAVLFAGLLRRRSWLKLLMGSVLQLDEVGWRALTWRWAFFFLVLAAINEVVWRSFSTDTWAAFKLFGIMPLTLAFGIAQVPLILRHQVPEAPQAKA